MKTAITRTTLVWVALIVLGLSLTGQSDAKIDPKTIVGIWLFDEGSGKTASDSSGNKNHATLTNEPTWVTTGKFGKALAFDGIDDYLVADDSDSLDIEEDMTICLWIKPDTWTSTYEGFVAKRFTTHVSCNYEFYLSSQSRKLSWFDGAERTGSYIPEEGTWVHIAAVVEDSASTVKFYVDGEYDSEVTGNTGSARDQKLIIGTGHPGGERYHGIMDELAIFNVALTEDNIKSFMKGYSTAVSPSGKLATAWGKIKT